MYTTYDTQTCYFMYHKNNKHHCQPLIIINPRPKEKKQKHIQ